jgi:hypothetical protein
MSSPTHPSLNDDGKSTSTMDVSVLQGLGQLLAAAARILNSDAFRRLGGPGLYRRVVSVLAAFLTFTIVMRVRQRASIAGRCFLDTVCEARRHLSHPPAGWAAP